MEKRAAFLIALVLLFVIGGIVSADETPAGSVSFNVKWRAVPKIFFGVAYEGFGDYAAFKNGTVLDQWTTETTFSDYVFQESEVEDIDENTDPYMDPYAEEKVCGPYRILAGVASNDWWKVEFIKPQLVSDNDHYTTVPVYARRLLVEWPGSRSKTGWFTGNDVIQKDMGVYGIGWKLKILFKNWKTRYGNYSNTFSIVCTQF